MFSFAQAQERARAWFDRKAKEQAGDFAPRDRPYTVADALADYRADYLAAAARLLIGSTGPPRLGFARTGSVPTRQADQGTDRRVASEDRRTAAAAAQQGRGSTEARRDRSEPEAVRRRRSTANRVLTILKATLNHAHREGRCASDDAWRTVRAFREADAARLRYLSDDEARRLVNACPADFRSLVTGALLTAARYGELTAMIV